MYKCDVSDEQGFLIHSKIILFWRKESLKCIYYRIMKLWANSSLSTISFDIMGDIFVLSNNEQLWFYTHIDAIQSCSTELRYFEHIYTDTHTHICSDGKPDIFE